MPHRGRSGPGKPAGGIGLALTFWSFCVKAKGHKNIFAISGLRPYFDFAQYSLTVSVQPDNLKRKSPCTQNVCHPEHVEGCIGD
jgi:hypothetical protein